MNDTMIPELRREFVRRCAELPSDATVRIERHRYRPARADRRVLGAVAAALVVAVASAGYLATAGTHTPPVKQAGSSTTVATTHPVTLGTVALTSATIPVADTAVHLPAGVTWPATADREALRSSPCFPAVLSDWQGDGSPPTAEMSFNLANGGQLGWSTVPLSVTPSGCMFAEELFQGASLTLPAGCQAVVVGTQTGSLCSNVGRAQLAALLVQVPASAPVDAGVIYLIDASGATSSQMATLMTQLIPLPDR